MFTYLALNIVFLGAALALSWRERKSVFSKPVLIALGIMLTLTLVFDNLIIATGIVAYDDTKLLGLKLGLAPIEDFFYPLAALIVMPYVWIKLRRNQ